MPRGNLGISLVKDYCFVFESKNLALDMLLHSTRQHNLFEVLTLIDQCLNSIFMRDTNYILLDDRSSI